MENSILIYKPGKTRSQLLECLEALKSEFTDQISEYDVKINKLPDGYSIDAEKKFLFLTFWIRAKILVREHEFDIIWETNAPDSKVKAAIEKVRNILEKC
jgi:hypothetical protein